MNGKKVTDIEINKIISLRQSGHSLPEICKVLQRGASTVHKYAKEVTIAPDCLEILKKKQGGSIIRSQKCWEEAKVKARKLLENVTARDKLFILAAIYWGEGTKNELNLINSDPFLIKVFLSCLKEIGVKESDLKVTIRLYDNIKELEAKQYWAEICGIDIDKIANVNILKGKKEGKLRYGMCRVRVRKGAESFKLIMSMIEFIKLQIIPAPIVQRIERGTPKP